MAASNSSLKGKAYEYACVLALKQIVEPIRRIKIEENNSLDIAKNHYIKDLSRAEQLDMLKSATAGIQAIINMEPRIVEDGRDMLTISLQPDNVAQQYGDIRDVLIIRRHISWEIGISVKHNHAALKHSRLSAHLDFGERWFGVPCSSQYFEEIAPVFRYLEELKDKGKAWRDIRNKEMVVYEPLLLAFKKEFERLSKKYKITAHLVSYLLGSNGKDYYKLMHKNNHTTTIMPFNFGGTLNQSAARVKPKVKIPKVDMPTRIIEMDFKERSKTTLILTMNNGWAVSFRIHNASTKVEPSLKFDVQLYSKPEELFYLDVAW